MQTGKVRFVFRHFAFIGRESVLAAEAAECANEQGRFWDYYDKIFAEQAGENVGAFAMENLIRFAQEIGLDSQAFRRCMENETYHAKVLQETQEGRNAGVRGTPTLFVNGEYVEGGGNYDILRAAVLKALGE